MEKKIAIRGHKTRGEDVIKALEDLGGKNLVGWDGIEEDAAFSINDQGTIDCLDLSYNQHYETYSLYTIEEYEALQLNMKGSGADTTEIGMKYKVGDVVKLKDREGLMELSRQDERIYIDPSLFEMAGTMQTISSVSDGFYVFEGNSWHWSENVIEEKVEERTAELLKWCQKAWKKVDEEMQERYEKMQRLEERWEHEFPCPDGYQFVDENGNVINATKIVLEKKKKEYPKTYEECLSVLGIYNGLPDVEIYNAKPSECKLFESLIRLKRCRDAYWKIAGEEMELGKDLFWIPDWMCLDPLYVILYQYHDIYKTEVNGGTSCILAFPTEEMRDAFYENFKSEIEICKELL